MVMHGSTGSRGPDAFWKQSVTAENQRRRWKPGFEAGAKPQRFELGAHCYHCCDRWGLTLNNKRCRNGMASQLGNETFINKKCRGKNSDDSVISSEFLCEKAASRCVQ